MRVLITGHTGFKGSWLSLLLAERGHEVSGISLDPLPGGLFDAGHLASVMQHDVRLDIRDAAGLADAVADIDAELVFHLAAQPLVRESYLDPRTTFDTNVTGTMNVLQAIERAPSTRGVVVITTDKVYRNVGLLAGYAEDEALGGDDPYSASKAMADILTQSWVKSFPGVPTAIARAGNVIGGGDVSKDRLLVDLIAGFASSSPVRIRYPEAVRPWQHVLDCLSGYLTLADALLGGGGTGAWNFGPDPDSFQTVREIADAAAAYWGGGAAWVDDSGDHLHEAALLTLDPSNAQRELGWQNELPFPLSLEWTLDWQRSVLHGVDPRAASERPDRPLRGAGSGRSLAARVLARNAEEAITTSAPTEQIRSVRVVGRRDIAPTIIELELAAVDDGPLPAWEPGAHIDLRLGEEVIRQYSLVPSADDRPSWTIAVLVEDEGRGGSRLIQKNVHVESIVKSSGPRNHFAFVEGASYLFIGGGIGITPLIAMCRAAEAAAAEWRLAYLGRSRAGMAYVAAIMAEFPDRVDVFAADEGERFDVESAIEALPADTHVYCCGPDRLMNAVEVAMSSPERVPFVHLEHFHPREAVQSENFEFTVYAAASDIEFIVPSDESILMAADFEGVIVPGDCLEGTCGSCETRVLMGQIEHRDSILSPQQRLRSETMMICVSRAKPGCTRLELDL